MSPSSRTSWAGGWPPPAWPPPQPATPSWLGWAEQFGPVEAWGIEGTGSFGAHLVLAGPAADSVHDDPEGQQVLQQVQEAWSRLPGSTRARVHLACLPMEDLEENGAIVNALQRHADVIVQKSLAEGFGLTVTEAMWKARPLVASRVGGIQDQITHGHSGLLVDDPKDLWSFGGAVQTLLGDRDRALQMGAEAHRRVCEEYLAPRRLTREMELINRVAS
jgi:trehalose synthase